MDNFSNNLSNSQTVQVTPFTDSIETNKELDNLGETLGQFKAYDSQLTIPEIDGTRIVKCLYQENKKTGLKVQENSYVRIPTKHLTEEHIVNRMTELAPYALGWLQTIEDAGIKEQHKKDATEIFCEYLSIDNLLERLEVAEAGSRLNKDKIEAWFNSSLAESLTILFADKLQLTDEATEEELHKLELILNAYKAKFASLASGKTYIKQDDCIAMIKVIESAEATNSLIGARFITRLTKMQDKEDETLLSL